MKFMTSTDQVELLVMTAIAERVAELRAKANEG